MKNLLIIEDDATFAAGLVRAFSRRGYACSLAASCAEGLEIARRQEPRYVLIDLNLGDETTQDLIAPLRRVLPKSVLVILTGFGTIPSTVLAMKDGADHYLCKPITPETIESAFETASSSRNGTSASLWNLENDHIVKVLEECGGNISQAAKSLGLHRRTLQRRLKKLDLSS